MNIPLPRNSSRAAEEHPKLYIALCMLIFAVPAFSVVVDHGASTPFLFLWLIGLFMLPRALKGVALEKDERVLLWLLLAYFLAVLGSWALADFNEAGYRDANRAARFLVVIPLYFLLRWLVPDSRWLAYGFFAGAIVAGLWALAHKFTGFDPDFGLRASGATHPILFGNIALIMGVMAFALSKIDASRLFRILTVVALIAGMVASLLSASRGGWIALPALILILIWYVPESLSLGKKMAILLVIAVLGVVLYMTPETGIQVRAQQAQHDIERYMSGDTMYNSLGERFAMWEASWMVFVDKPLTGSGVGLFIGEAHRLMREGAIGEFDTRHYHAHNIYMTVLAQQGLIGLSLMMALLLFPLWLFVKHLRDADTVIRSVALAGVCLVVGYMHFGLSEAVFTRSLTTIFYAFNIVMLVSTMYARKTAKA